MRFGGLNLHEAARPHALHQGVDVAAEGRGEGGGCKEGAGLGRRVAERGCRGAEAGRERAKGALEPGHLQMRTSESSILAATDSPASPWVHLCRMPLASR